MVTFGSFVGQFWEHSVSSPYIQVFLAIFNLSTFNRLVGVGHLSGTIEFGGLKPLYILL